MEKQEDIFGIAISRTEIKDGGVYVANTQFLFTTKENRDAAMEDLCQRAEANGLQREYREHDSTAKHYDYGKKDLLISLAAIHFGILDNYSNMTGFPELTKQ